MLKQRSSPQVFPLVSRVEQIHEECRVEVANILFNVSGHSSPRGTFSECDIREENRDDS